MSAVADDEQPTHSLASDATHDEQTIPAEKLAQDQPILSDTTDTASKEEPTPLPGPTDTEKPLETTTASTTEDVSAEKESEGVAEEAPAKDETTTSLALEEEDKTVEEATESTQVAIEEKAQATALVDETPSHEDTLSVPPSNAPEATKDVSEELEKVEDVIEGQPITADAPAAEEPAADEAATEASAPEQKEETLAVAPSPAPEESTLEDATAAPAPPLDVDDSASASGLATTEPEEAVVATEEPVHDQVHADFGETAVVEAHAEPAAEEEPKDASTPEKEEPKAEIEEIEVAKSPAEAAASEAHKTETETAVNEVPAEHPTPEIAEIKAETQEVDKAATPEEVLVTTEEPTVQEAAADVTHEAIEEPSPVTEEVAPVNEPADDVVVSESTENGPAESQEPVVEVVDPEPAAVEVEPVTTEDVAEVPTVEETVPAEVIGEEKVEAVEEKAVAEEVQQEEAADVLVSAVEPEQIEEDEITTVEATEEPAQVVEVADAVEDAPTEDATKAEAEATLPESLEANIIDLVDLNATADGGNLVLLSSSAEACFVESDGSPSSACSPLVVNGAAAAVEPEKAIAESVESTEVAAAAAAAAEGAEESEEKPVATEPEKPETAVTDKVEVAPASEAVIDDATAVVVEEASIPESIEKVEAEPVNAADVQEPAVVASEEVEAVKEEPEVAPEPEAEAEPVVEAETTETASVEVAAEPEAPVPVPEDVVEDTPAKAEDANLQEGTAPEVEVVVPVEETPVETVVESVEVAESVEEAPVIEVSADEQADPATETVAEVVSAGTEDEAAEEKEVLTVQTDVSEPAARPQSPWTPSYSVTTQGPGITSEEPVEEQAEAPEVETTIEEPESSVPEFPEAVVEKAAEDSKPETEASSSWPVSYSVSSQGKSPLQAAQDVSSDDVEAIESLDAAPPVTESVPVEVVEEPTTALEPEAPAVDVTTVEEAKEAAEPDVSVQEQDEEVLTPPQIVATDENAEPVEPDVPTDEPVEVKEAEVLASPVTRPWTPSYTVTQQGTSPTQAVAELLAEEAAPVPASPKEEPTWTPSYSVSRQGSKSSLKVAAAEAEPAAAPPPDEEPQETSPVVVLTEEPAAVVDAEPVAAPAETNWSPSYSVSRQGSKASLKPELKAEEAAAAPVDTPPSPVVQILAVSDETCLVNEPAVTESNFNAQVSTWTPSYSVSRQGSKSSLKVAEPVSADEPEAEPVPVSIVVDDPAVAEADKPAEIPAVSDVAPAAEEVSAPAAESIRVPSYSVSRQGSKSSLRAEAQANAEEPPTLTQPEEVQPSVQIVAEPDEDAPAPAPTTDDNSAPTWTPSYSVSRQGSRSSLNVPAAEPVVAEPEIQEPVAVADESAVPTTERPWTPSYSVSRQGSRASLKAAAEPEAAAVTVVADEPPAVAEPEEVAPIVAVTLEPEETTTTADEPAEAPERPWTPSYSVSRQGSSPKPVEKELEPVAAETESVKPATEDTTPVEQSTAEAERPWTPSYTVTKQGTSPLHSPKVDTTNLEPAVVTTPDAAAEERPWTPSYAVTRQGTSPLLKSAELEVVVDDVQVPVTDEPASTPSIHVQEVTQSTVTDTDGSVTVAESDAGVEPAADEEKPVAASWTPSYSVSQQGSSPISTPQVTAKTLEPEPEVTSVSVDVKEQPAQQQEPAKTAVDEEAVPESAIEQATETSKSETSWTPSYSVTVQGPGSPATSNGNVDVAVERQAFPTSEVQENIPKVSNKPSLARLAPVDEHAPANATSPAQLEPVSPTTTATRSRIESTTSSRFFPGGWFSGNPKTPEDNRASLDHAAGEFTKHEGSTLSPAAIEVPANTPVEGSAPHHHDKKEKKHRMCIIM